MERLGDHLAALRSAFDDGDMEELAALAHRLKGSGGSVGFDVFTQPAAELEQHAKAGARDEIPALLDQLENLRSRIQLDKGDGETARVRTSIDRLDIPEFIESSLASKGARFHEIIFSFVDRLDEQLEAMERSLSERNFAQLAQLAHWLKGSGGSVGFGGFTAPAADLERAARGEKEAQAADCLLLIKELRSRIVLPELADASTAQR